MTPSTRPKAAIGGDRIWRVECDVSPDDIEEMLDRFDSGMADIRSANAIAIALNHLVRPEIRGIMLHAESGWIFRVGDEEIELPGEVTRWMEKWSRGLPGGAFRFPVGLREDYLRAETPAGHAIRALGATVAERADQGRGSGRERRKAVDPAVTLSGRMSA